MEHERCDACGFDGARYDDASLLHALRILGPRWRSLLSQTGPELRERPEPEVWSALEYAAHSRDITALHVFGVEQALNPLPSRLLSMLIVRPVFVHYQPTIE